VRLVPQSEEDRVRAFRGYPGSLLQIAQHNALLHRIEVLRNVLESCSAQEITSVQGQIKEVRRQLAELHYKDPKSVKDIYA
jgi:lactam utilization protein B